MQRAILALAALAVVLSFNNVSAQGKYNYKFGAYKIMFNQF